ncbi:MAG: hypothetical protein ACE5JK_02620 [Candidatus Omnitrophota bacterium]
MPSKAPRIKVDSKNRLVVSGGKLPEKVVLDGRWSLTEEHDLKLHLRASKSGLSGKTVILRGDIEKVTGSSLAFRVRVSENISGLRTGSIQLKGRWQADSYNRITFHAAKSRGRYDTLTFQGAWQVNGNNELIYRYVKTYLKTKIRTVKTLTFKGYWQLGERRIVYRLDRADNSFFSVKAALQTRSLIAREGKIRYQVGIRYQRRKVYRKARETITIFGVWKLDKDLKIAFEVKYSGRKKQEMRFIVEKLVAKGSTISVSLKAESGEPLGIQVKFTKTFKNDAELFLSLSRYPDESRIMGGVTIKF